MKLVLKILLPILIIAAGVGGFLALKSSRPPPVAIEAPEKQWAVDAIFVNATSYQPIAQLYGRIESLNRSKLSAAIAADINIVAAREGQQVVAGQLLVEIDQRDLVLRLQQRDAELAELDARMGSEDNVYAADQAALKDELGLLALAERGLARAQKLARTKAGSEVGVDEAHQTIRTRSLAVTQRRRSINDHTARTAQLQANVIRIKSLKAQVETDLERAHIRAPFDARITEIHVSPGERVRVGDPLLELYDVSQLEARAQLPERYVTLVRESFESDRVILGELDIGGQLYGVVLDRFAGSIRTGQGGLDGFFRFSQEDEIPAVEVGRVVPIRVSLPAVENAISLPVSALYGSNTVYRIIDGRLENVAVEYIGEHHDVEGSPRVLVRSIRLESGDQVITTQIPAAVTGLKVSVNSS
jgi:multidrug efflux pump subunit AcrA (membrane-fusion protein)